MLFFREFFDEQESKVYNMYNLETPIKKIKEEIGVSYPEIYRILEKYGIEPNRHRRGHAIVEKLSAMGYDMDTIAHMSNYTKRHIRNIKNGSK